MSRTAPKPPSLSKLIYDAGASLRRMNVEIQNGDFDDQKISRDGVKKLAQAANDLCALLYRHT